MNNPDYKNSITNLSNSILSHFGVEPFHNTIPEIDELIKDKKKVIVFLFDGMGRAVLEKHVSENSFLRSHIVHNIKSTIPPTTVASTTSFLSGRYPIETGWLGWTLYFDEVDRLVNVFPNKDDITGEKIPGPHLMNTKCPYKNICELINEKNGKDIAHQIMGYPVDPKTKQVKKLKSFIKYAYQTAQSTDESFVYAYWVSPDAEMHADGVTADSVHKVIIKIQKYMEKYSAKNKDVCTLIIADHGMTDINWLKMNEHPDLLDLLVRPLSIEKRCANFHVKEGKCAEFAELFNRYYGEYYVLLTKEEALKQAIFGDSKPSEEALYFLGDFIALAQTKNTLEPPKLETKKKPFIMKAHHAGNTLDEMDISVIKIN